MNIRFAIHYQTQWGQELRVVGSSPELGGWDFQRAPAMTYVPGGYWNLTLTLAKAPREPVAYKYCLVHASGGVEWEWGPNRELPAGFGRVARVAVDDIWRCANVAEHTLCSDAFARAILGGPRRVRAAANANANAAKPAVATKASQRCRFRVVAPRVPPGQVLCVLGSDPQLGGWDERQAVILDETGFPEWEVQVALTSRNTPVQYKYAVYDPQRKRVTHWETGANRAIWPDLAHTGLRLVIRHDGLFRHGEAPWRGAGVAVPVFSLRSTDGLGVGEFPDIKPLVDWTRATGLRMIQLLPVNDTVASHTWVDSYPYAAVSVFALHPIYMRLEDMGVLKPAETRAYLKPHRAKLNALAELDYEEVMRVKSRFFKIAYDRCRDAFLRDKDYQAFFEANRGWLVPYAAFSCLRDRYDTSDYAAWPDHQNVTAAELAAFTDPAAPHFDDVAVHYFIQYHLHRQLLDAANYARAHGVALKGDIPIGVYRHSVDTWVDRHSFNLKAQAGAPPDDFAADGQNWGFPTYNWRVMAEDGFAWWRQRLTHLATYFDAFRIDHILGFFRIWEIPLECVQGILGHFSPAFTVSREELAGRGIWFDRERLCRPYIRAHMLAPIFGIHADHVRFVFLDEGSPGCFRLKQEYRTQRDVEQVLAEETRRQPELAHRNEAVKWGLFRLMAEVIFLEADGPDGNAFYPRHSLQRTTSYQELDADMQWRLSALYTDYFYKRHEHFWREQSMRRLPPVRSATNMLICGEDLGMVPDCVPGVMHELGILSLSIQRMPKDPRQEFSHPADCPYLSVCSPSTHDMRTLRGWWTEDRARTQRFFNHLLGRWGEAPEEAGPDICRDIVAQHLFSPAMWAVFPLQDLFALDPQVRRADAAAERINEPSNPRHYWRYRMHLSLENLLGATRLNETVRELIGRSGRNAEA